MSFEVHHAKDQHGDTSLPDPHQDTFSRTVLGFWIYLMTDCLLFATLFATYAVLRKSTFGGPSTKDLFHLDAAFTQTMLLLFSSVTCGFAMLASLKNRKKQVITWLLATFMLGATFVILEFIEFRHLVQEGYSWKRSAFLSSFFTLVGTHGLHVSFGLLWMFVMLFQVHVKGITMTTFRRLIILSLFWHFLDVIWIFIFTFVYLMGVL